MVHWHHGDKRISCTLELDGERTAESKIITYKTGPTAYTIDKSTGKLSQGEMLRGEDIASAIKHKVERSLDVVLARNETPKSMPWFYVELASRAWQGHYPSHMGEVDVQDPIDCYWMPNVHQSQGRLYVKYLTLHENLLHAVEHSPSLDMEAFEEDLENVDGMAKSCMLDEWVRDTHRAKEQKRLGKRKKQECAPRAKEFLAFWDDWLRIQVTKWPSNEAKLREDWDEDLVGLIERRKATKARTKVRAGMAFAEFSADQRPFFSKDCTAAEWQDAIAQAVAIEKEKDEQERLAAKRDTRKHEELEAKLKKKAAADKARENAEREARRLGDDRALLPDVYVVSSTTDWVCSPSAHGDRVVRELKRCGVHVHYQRENFGAHGFSCIPEWTDPCARWLRARLAIGE